MHYYLTDSELIQSQCFCISMSQQNSHDYLFEENKYCMSSPGPGKNVNYHFNYHKDATTTVLSLTVGILQYAKCTLQSVFTGTDTVQLCMHHCVTVLQYISIPCL